MTIQDDIKAKIQAEFDQWKDSQYIGQSIAQRQARGAFYTPPQLSIQMLEKYDDLEGSILDPTAGAGGLLAAAVIAGADPKKCFGIELDPETALLCRERLAKLGVPRSNVKVGDALVDSSYEFEEPADVEIYFRVEDLGCSKVKIFVERNSSSKVVQKELVIDYASSEDSIKKKFETLYKLFSLAEEGKAAIYTEKAAARMKFMNAFFKKYVGKKINAKAAEI